MPPLSKKPLPIIKSNDFADLSQEEKESPYLNINKQNRKPQEKTKDMEHDDAKEATQQFCLLALDEERGVSDREHQTHMLLFNSWAQSVNEDHWRDLSQKFPVLPHDILRHVLLPYLNIGMKTKKEVEDMRLRLSLRSDGDLLPDLQSVLNFFSFQPFSFFDAFVILDSLLPFITDREDQWSGDCSLRLGSALPKTPEKHDKPESQAHPLTHIKMLQWPRACRIVKWPSKRYFISSSDRSYSTDVWIIDTNKGEKLDIDTLFCKLSQPGIKKGFVAFC